MAIKAWAVSDDDWDTCDLVHAETASKAKALCWMDGDWWTDLRVRRAPEFDGLLHTTDRQRIDRGWWVECNGCGRELHPVCMEGGEIAWGVRDEAYCDLHCWQYSRDKLRFGKDMANAMERAGKA